MECRKCNEKNLFTEGSVRTFLKRNEKCHRNLIFRANNLRHSKNRFFSHDFLLLLYGIVPRKPYEPLKIHHLNEQLFKVMKVSIYVMFNSIISSLRFSRVIEPSEVCIHFIWKNTRERKNSIKKINVKNKYD